MVNRKEILETALELTTSTRREIYGSPYVNHERIAKIWEVILGVPVTPSQVALCMVGVKLARIVESPDHLDSFIDGAAYMAIAAEIVEEPVKEQNGHPKTKPGPIQTDPCSSTPCQGNCKGCNKQKTWQPPITTQKGENK